MPKISAPMSCRDAVDRFGAERAGELGPARWRYYLHLLACRSCRRLRRSYARTIELCALSRDAPIAETPEELVQRILRAHDRR